jgi:transcription elongation GreA/GreB family factor
MKISKQLADDLRKWNSPVHLTPAGLKRLQAKLERLKNSVPHLVSEAARTAAYGDRSENAEYKDAKATLRRTYRQISGIEDQLKRVAVIDIKKNTAGTIQLGSTVVLENKKGVRKTFQILGPQESAPAEGRISYQSPLGAALMDRAKLDEIKVQTASGVQEYRIIDVL